MTKKHEQSILSDLRVGILFNSPVMPSKGETVDYVADAEVEDEVEAVEKALQRLDLEYARFPLKDDIASLIDSLKDYNMGVVINLCEAAFGESRLEMAVPSMLELLRIPYTGSSSLALGLCQNKGLTKTILNAKGILTPEYQVLNKFEDWHDEISYPLFVKPLNEDGSIGITKKSFVEDERALKTQVEYIIERYRQSALVEKYIAGRELNVAILGNEKTRILPISEIIFEFSHEPKIVDYSAKWFKDSEEYKKTIPMCPAKLDLSTKALIEREALKTYAVLYCRDYVRVDMRLNGQVPYVIEVNPNPDISPDGGYARSLKAAGISYEEFLREIICSALKRKVS